MIILYIVAYIVIGMVVAKISAIVDSERPGYARGSIAFITMIGWPAVLIIFIFLMLFKLMRLEAFFTWLGSPTKESSDKSHYRLYRWKR
jgi:hypothetical protein